MPQHNEGNEIISTQEIISFFKGEPLNSELAKKESNLADDLNNRANEAKVNTLIVENQILKENKEARKKYAYRTFILTCSWSVFLICVIFLCGYEKMKLSDKVIITLITSTTVNFFGFFLLVMKYLFDTNHSKNKTSGKP
jgi:hypothetical protein